MIFNKKSKKIKYMEEELARLENNLKRLSNGEFNLQYETKQQEDIFSEEGSRFQEIDRYMNGIADTYNELLKDTDALKRSLLSGEVDYRIRTAGNNGVIRKIAENVNNSLDAVFAPFGEIKDILELVEKNDLTKSVTGSYKGKFGELTNTLNMVITRLRSVQDAFVKLSEGDTSLLEKFESVGQRSYNDKLMPAAIQANRFIRSLIADINRITTECANGNIKAAKGDPEEYPGGYKEIITGVNNSITSLSKPIYEALDVLTEMEVNDYTKRMGTDEKGDFLVLANAINNVQKRLLSAQNVAQKISRGDIGELDNFRKIGRRSENDHLVPAFIAMMEAIQDLINETAMLSKAAGEGELTVRGNAGKFQGGYADIISGMNSTLDGVVTPVREAIDVLTIMSEGHVDCRVKGEYKGAYEKLKNALNSTLDSLNMVITDIGSILKNISEGNLNINFTKDYDGDYRIISDSLKEIIKALNNTLAEVNASAEQVASGAGQISQASLILSQGAEEQASSIEQVVASLSEVSTQVKQNAANADEANKLSLIAKNNATKGNVHMKEMQQAMYDINTSSTNISKIIKVIDDIAFQTNILALNAAVEAARAGQYGKGFAVVAEEVRNLAQKSAGAAKDTTTMIEGSIEKVEAGTKIANNTAAALNEIVDSITKTAELVEAIASASTEQATAIFQVNQAVDQVSGVIQTNSATAEESAASSEELSSQADHLKQMVGRFKLKKSQTAGEFGIEGASSEVLKAIQEMLKNKNTDTENKNEGDSKAPSKSKISIKLDDMEFGKY